MTLTRSNHGTFAAALVSTLAGAVELEVVTVEVETPGVEPARIC